MNTFSNYHIQNKRNLISKTIFVVKAARTRNETTDKLNNTLYT